MNKNKFFTKNRIIYMSLALVGIVLFVISAYVLDYAELLQKTHDSIVVIRNSRVIEILGLAMQYGGGASIIVGLLGVVFSKTMRPVTTLIPLAPVIAVSTVFLFGFQSTKTYPIESVITGTLFALSTIASLVLFICYINIKAKYKFNDPKFKTFLSVLLDILTAVLYFLPCLYAGSFMYNFLNYLIHG